MRTLLIVPATSARQLEEALEAGADALLIDVVAGEPRRARVLAAEFIAAHRALPCRPRLYAQVSPFEAGAIQDDLDAVMPARPDGVALARCGGGADVQRLGGRLAAMEARHGLPDGATRILALGTPNAAAIFALSSYASASARLEGLAWSPENLRASLGAAQGDDPSPMRLARDLTMIAAVAAGITPIDAAFTNPRDEAGLRAACLAARRDGFRAKFAIEAAQIPVIEKMMANPQYP